MLFCNAFAGLEQNRDSIQPEIKLNHIAPVEHGETNADELYFDVTVLDQNNKRRFFRIPEAPMHWSSKRIEQFKNISLWRGTLIEGQKVVLIFALMEADGSPINPDDLIGTIRVQLMNESGVLKAKWTIPNRTTGPTTIVGKYGEIQEFLLTSDDGSYKVYLELPKKN